MSEIICEFHHVDENGTLTTCNKLAAYRAGWYFSMIRNYVCEEHLPTLLQHLKNDYIVTDMDFHPVNFTSKRNWLENIMYYMRI